MQIGQFCMLKNDLNISEIEKLDKLTAKTINYSKTRGAICFVVIKKHNDKIIYAEVHKASIPMTKRISIDGIPYWIKYQGFQELPSDFFIPIKIYIPSAESFINSMYELNLKEMKKNKNKNLKEDEYAYRKHKLAVEQRKRRQKEIEKSHLKDLQRQEREKKRIAKLHELYETPEYLKPKKKNTPQISTKTSKSNHDHNQKQSKNKFRVIYRRYKSVAALATEDIIYELQIIKGSNNHVARDHSITDKVIKLAYRSDNGEINIIEMTAHYCENCNVYFDFYESFKEQLKRYSIKIDSVLVQYYDANRQPISFEINGLHNYSKLSLFGYSVGKSGMNISERHKLLQFLIDNKIMKTFEIKNHLEFLIRYNGAKHNMENAVHDWLFDIDFINQIIKLKKHN